MGFTDDILLRGISPEERVQGLKSAVKMSSTAPKVSRDIHIQFFEQKPSPVPSRSGSRYQSQSDRRRTASALKIQKVFRGFLVRRSTKKLIAIKRDMDEIERSISNGETLDWILIDKKEGLRVIETLMNLLFKLDSVSGINSDVRDCRKSVAARAISLQEIVDAAVSAVDRTETQTLGVREDDSQRNSESAAQTLESIATDEQYSDGQIDESDSFNFDKGSQCSSEYDDEGAGIGDDAENSEDNEVGDFVMVGDNLGTGDKEEEDESRDDDGVDESLQESLDTSLVEETLTEGGAIMENDASISPVEETSEKREESKRNELLLKMMEENQKMMSQLCENYETQMKMLESLTRRVQQLEMSNGHLYRMLKKKNNNNSNKRSK